jgi:hypothetical protein
VAMLQKTLKNSSQNAGQIDGKGLPDEAYFEKQKTGIIVYSKK